MTRSDGVLDLLVVGGGPAGTAAAFRAKELHLAALVIEHDDVMRRIRDYAKGKPIKPDFGAGKQMGFPNGGPLVAQLQFEEIDKDLMHQHWRELYERNEVPVRTGMELVGLERRGDIWDARVRNHPEQQTETLATRHVLLALGGGMPRPLDIPGNVGAVSGNLRSADRFVGAPACVIGGGSSAAEAVIAISNAKAAAGDTQAVYWVYRGEKMPAVAEALAPELFQAVNLNGNVRYLPNAEPVAIVSSPDGSERLRVEVDRKALPNRPVESVNYEFLASHALACIGQELPKKLLAAIGIVEIAAGQNNRSGFVLTAVLETNLPNVYMAGDMLNTAYHECRGFTDDPTTFEERSHRGNIKRALTDGVIVAQTVAQKLAGREQIDIVLTYTEPPAAAPPRPADGRAEVPPPVALQPGPARPAAPTPAPAAAQTHALVRLLADGIEADQFLLAARGTTTIGREQADISFKDDTAMAPRHVSLEADPDGHSVSEVDERGAFVRLTAERARAILPGAMLKVGNQWLVFGVAPQYLMVTQYDAQGIATGRHQLPAGTTVAGRDPGALMLSTTDRHLSRRHVSFTVEPALAPDAGPRIIARDLKSANGTYLALRKGMRLDAGDEIHVGHQILRFSAIEQPSAATIIHVDTNPPVAVRPLGGAALPPPGPAPAPNGLVVTFQGTGKSCAFRVGQPILEIAEANGLPIDSECRQGRCGLDPISIVSGEDKLNAMTETEKQTLRDVCKLELSRHRLACVTRPTGPVVVKIEG